MQEQLTQLYAEIDAGTFRRRVDDIRAAHTAPGTADDAEPPLAAAGGGASSYLASREIDRAGSGGGGSGTAGGTSTQEINKISRYRHRDMIEYNDVCNLPWPAGMESGQGLRPGAQGYSDATDGVGRGDVRAVNPGGHAPFPICHQFAAPLPLESRMSFTILNLTGQRTRYFQPRAGDETRYLRYLRVRVAQMSVMRDVTRKCKYNALVVAFCFPVFWFARLHFLSSLPCC